MDQPAQRKVCVVLVDRANYGRMKPVMRSIAAHPDLELQTLAAGTMVLERFDLPVEGVRRDGFRIDGEIFMELEGSLPSTMAKSVGFGVVEFASEFQRLKPDIVLLIGDRFEAMAAATAAAYMNLCLVHIQGGEVSGSIDESARHAISKLSHFHVPSTQRSADFLVRMGEAEDTILTIGCPSSDIARELEPGLSPAVVSSIGSGREIDVGLPFLLVVFHPVTTHYGDERQQIQELLEALHELRTPTLLLWPNVDAGSGAISKAIRVFRTERRPDWLRMITNLSPEDYLRVLRQAACAIGNSSSFVRDASYFGTPVVLVGDRQTGREVAGNLLGCPPQRDRILAAARRQLDHGRYPKSALYGDGAVSARVANALAQLQPYVQKTLSYVSLPTASRKAAQHA